MDPSHPEECSADPRSPDRSSPNAAESPPPQAGSAHSGTARQTDNRPRVSGWTPASASRTSPERWASHPRWHSGYTKQTPRDASQSADAAASPSPTHRDPHYPPSTASPRGSPQTSLDRSASPVPAQTS